MFLVAGITEWDTHTHLYHVHAWCLRKPEEGVGFPATLFQSLPWTLDLPASTSQVVILHVPPPSVKTDIPGRNCLERALWRCDIVVTLLKKPLCSAVVGCFIYTTLGSCNVIDCIMPH